jgi:predicted Zn finger-like uncharacterized protein
MSIVLSCPSCSTRYRANAEAIGASGRRVRCASCGHVWTAESENPTVQGAPQAAPAAAAPAEPETESLPHKAFRARQERKRHTLSVAAAGGAWGGFLAACLLLAACSWIFRVDIVTLWPRAASAYAAVGAEVTPDGLTVSELHSRRETDHGVPLLVVEGEIHNFDRRSREIPGLRAVLRDAHGEAVLEWPVNLPHDAVRAGREQAFRTVVSDPPPSAVEVEVTLVVANTAGHAADEHHPAPAPDSPAHDSPAHDSPAHGSVADHASPQAHPVETAHAEPVVDHHVPAQVEDHTADHTTDPQAPSHADPAPANDHH